jgi:hypothetical protein
LRLFLRFRWFVTVVALLLLSTSIALAVMLLNGPPDETLLQLSQRLSQAAGTLVVAAVYLWREYFERRTGGSGNAIGLGGAATASVEVSAGPRIVQNIYPPSSAPTTTAAATQTAGASIKAERFVLVDQAGCERAALAIDERGCAALRIVDRWGRRRINLAVGPDGFSELAFGDTSGATRIQIGTPGESDFAYLVLRGERTYVLAADGAELTETVWNGAARREWSAPIRPRASQACDKSKVLD